MKILLSESQIVRLVRGDLDEEITGGSIIVYHRTRLSKENLKLLNQGFVPGDGAMYGRGLYSTYELKDQFSPNMSGYGSTIVKFQVMDTSKILIFDESEQVKVFGSKVGVLKQMKRILKGEFKKFYSSNKQNIDFALNRLTNKDALTSEAAHAMSQIPKFQILFDGMVFTGRNDGRVLVLFETNSANPIQYADTRNPGPNGDIVWTNLKNKDAYKIGKDKRGHGKLDNYIRHRQDINFNELKNDDKKEYIRTKIKHDFSLTKDEYKYFIDKTSPDQEELDRVNLTIANRDSNSLSYIVDPSDEVIKRALSRNGENIQYINNPSDTYQILAVATTPISIRFIKNPSDEVINAAIRGNVTALQYIDNPSEQVQKKAVERSVNAIRFIKNPSEDIQIYAVSIHPDAIQYIDKPTERVQIESVKTFPRNIRYIDRPSEELQKYVMKKAPSNFQYIQNPTEPIKLLAAQIDGNNIRFMGGHASEEIILAALNQTGEAITYVPNPTDEMKLLAVQTTPSAISRISNPSEELQKIVINHNPDYIRLIHNPTEEIQLYSVGKNPQNVFRIMSPTEKVRMLAIKLDGSVISRFSQTLLTPEVQKLAVTSDPMSLQYIHNPTEEAQLIAVKANPLTIKLIRNPSREVQIAAAENDPVAAMSHANKVNLGDVESLKGLSTRELQIISMISRNPESFKRNPKMLDIFLKDGKISKEVYDRLKKKLGIISEEVFKYSELTDDERERVYDIFRTSYQNSTGSAWSQPKFTSRANDWDFFGDRASGFVVLRKQRSGMAKLTGVAGDLKSISLGMSEINALNEPVWGMADKRIQGIVTKKFDYYTPPPFILKIMMQRIPSSVFGGADYDVNDDGSVTFKYTDVGDATKYFFANKQYYEKMFPAIANNIDGMSPQMVDAAKMFFSSIF